MAPSLATTTIPFCREWKSGTRSYGCVTCRRAKAVKRRNAKECSWETITGDTDIREFIIEVENSMRRVLLQTACLAEACTKALADELGTYAYAAASGAGRLHVNATQRGIANCHMERAQPGMLAAGMLHDQHLYRRHTYEIVEALRAWCSAASKVEKLKCDVAAFS
eukprot:2905217-Pleurochrysis_carterae.AAC.2